MFLRVALEDDRARVLKESVLNNYHYEYWSWDGILGKACCYDMISFGMTMYYNHDSPGHLEGNTGPNIEQRKVGQEPDLEFPERSVAIVYFALRDIEAGEEFLVDYGRGWFEGRGMKAIDSASTPDFPKVYESLHTLMKGISTKVALGYHTQAFQRVIASMNEDDCDDVQPYRLETAFSMLPRTKACFGRVTTRQHIGKGETIDFVPALLLQKSLIESTIIHPLVFSWDDIDESSPALSELKRPFTVYVQYQPDLETTTPETRMMQISVDDSVLFVLAGGISMMARCERATGWRGFNAILHAEEDPCNRHGYCVRAVAARPIASGENVVIGVKSRISAEEVQTELCLTGQPFHSEGDDEPYHES